MSLKRKEIILKYIVEDFVSTCEPVGSKMLLSRHKLPYSSATIRNDMMELEEDGLIEKTHTSSGRVPSIEGYRYYVTKLRSDKSDKSLKFELDKILDNKTSIEDLIREACSVLSNMTKLSVCFLGPSIIEEKITKLELVPLNETNFTYLIVTSKGYLVNKTYILNKEDSFDKLIDSINLINDLAYNKPVIELMNIFHRAIEENKEKEKELNYLYELTLNLIKDFVAKRNTEFYGKEHLLDLKEFQEDTQELKSLFRLLSNPVMVSEMFNGSSETAISIGNGSLKDITIITKNIRTPSSNEELGKIALVGPTRMDYEKVLLYLDYVVDMIMYHLKEIKESVNDERRKQSNKRK